MKELANNKYAGFASGHGSCTGCAFPIIVRAVMRSTKYPLVVTAATGCLEVTSTIYPNTSWQVPFIHSAFENAAATISGVEAAYKALKKKGKIKEDIKFIAFGGDGGTYDIGLQSLSGAIERGHDFTYICYDNEGYSNTGNQRSSATPYGAHTTTEPQGKESIGKTTFRKNLTKIMAAHNIPYVAQASISNYPDLIKKAKKAIETPGPAVLIVLSPCTLFWRMDPSLTVEVSKKAVETCFWPLYEVIDGKYIINQKPQQKPIEEFLKSQARFKHMKKEDIKILQDHINKEWSWLLKQEAIDNVNNKS